MEVEAVQFIIADTFQDGLTKLDPQDQGIVKQKAFDFQANPSHPGFQLHKLDDAAEKNFWSAYINMDLRMIVYRDGARTVLCYTDHHDAAYAWAERHKLDISDTTGAAQIITTQKRVEEVVDIIRRTEVRKPALFAHYEDNYLSALGVPPEWLDAVKDADEDSFLEHLLEELPSEVSERLARLANGEPVKRPIKEEIDDPFAHPDAQSKFLVVEDDLGSMERALSAPWDKWLVFLHPSQRTVVNEDYTGPARVTGGAGTGKTVVALHRAARLARNNPTARILLTTFSKTLAARLQQNLERLVGAETPELERIDVTNLHNLAVERWNAETGRTFKPFHPHQGLLELVHEAIEVTDGSEFSAEWLSAEWEAIIDTEGIESWEEYESFPRAGRGSSLTVSQRRSVWPIFEHVQTSLTQRGEFTWQGLCYATAKLLSKLETPVYKHVVADEIQDFGPAELRLLRALIPESENDLFVTGDLGQRIYKGKTSFLDAGIDIRGRSSILDINYRTTEQIRRHADKILPPGQTDGDGMTETRTSVSLLSGPEPTFAFERDAQLEVETASKWLKHQLSNGFKPEEVAIFARTNKLVRDRAEQVVGRCALKAHDLKDDEPPRSKCVSVGTMHRAKGLEFRAVLVMGCEDHVVPYQSAYSKQPDAVSRAAFLEREQNLLYVACTRARDRLFISGAGTISRFLRR